MELKGSKTEQNLMTAFAGESQARNKYTFFASQAKKDGYEQIAAIFQETADNEKEHAKLWFKLLNGGAIGSTEENLKAAGVKMNTIVNLDIYYQPEEGDIYYVATTKDGKELSNEEALKIEE